MRLSEVFYSAEKRLSRKSAQSRHIWKYPSVLKDNGKSPIDDRLNRKSSMNGGFSIAILDDA